MCSKVSSATISIYVDFIYENFSNKQSNKQINKRTQKINKQVNKREIEDTLYISLLIFISFEIS